MLVAGINRNVGDLYGLLRGRHFAHGQIASRAQMRLGPAKREIFGRDIMHRSGAMVAVFDEKQLTEFGSANACRVFQYGIRKRAAIARRRADDAQHLGRHCLLLQQLGEIVGTLAQFVEQPRVLDGDDGLGGEVLQQLDLLVGERRTSCR